MKQRPRQPGFTLFELVLVLVIISVVLAMAAPSLSGWARSAKLRNAIDDLLRATRAARSSAVTNAATYRLCLDVKAGRYWLMVQDGEGFVNVDASYGREQLLVPGLRLEVTKTTPAPKAGSGGLNSKDTSASGDEPYVEFSSTGRTEPAVIKVVSEQGESASIECVSPAEPFRTVTSNENK